MLQRPHQPQNFRHHRKGAGWPGIWLLPVPAYAAVILVVVSFLLGHQSHVIFPGGTSPARQSTAQQQQQQERQEQEQAAPGGQQPLPRALLAAPATQPAVIGQQQDSQQGSQQAASQPGSQHDSQRAQGRPADSEPKRGSLQAAGGAVLADPLDSDALEQWMLDSSGLSSVRPPVPTGQSGEAQLRVLPFQILSWAPRLVVFPAFIDQTRCEAIIQLGKAMLTKSGLAYRPGERQDQAGQQTRTSSGVFLDARADPKGILKWVEQRIAAATHIPVSHGEPFNLLRYEHGQLYESHMDSFDPKEFGPQPTQRIATVLIFLTDVDEGGHTIFKREGVGNSTLPINDWRNCNDGQGFKYKPRRGDAVLFYDAHPNGELDGNSLHGGCPVEKGEKWVMTKWLHDKQVRWGH